MNEWINQWINEQGIPRTAHPPSKMALPQASLFLLNLQCRGRSDTDDGEIYWFRLSPILLLKKYRKTYWWSLDLSRNSVIVLEMTYLYIHISYFVTEWKTKKLYAASYCVCFEFIEFNFDKDGVLMTSDFGPAIYDSLSKWFEGYR